MIFGASFPFEVIHTVNFERAVFAGTCLSCEWSTGNSHFKSNTKYLIYSLTKAPWLTTSTSENKSSCGDEDTSELSFIPDDGVSVLRDCNSSIFVCFSTFTIVQKRLETFNKYSSHFWTFTHASLQLPQFMCLTSSKHFSNKYMF